MKRATKILRRSIFTFLKNYETMATKAALLALPFSASVLISQALVSNGPSASKSSIDARLGALVDASGLSRSSYSYATLLTGQLSQTVTCWIFTLPFSLSFFLVSKSYVIKSLRPQDPTDSALAIYAPLLATYAFNSLVVLSANATVFAVSVSVATALDALGLDRDRGRLFLAALGTVAYSVVLANVVVICNLALALSGMERLGGHWAALKACVLMRGKASTGLSLALPLGLGLAATEALFQYRVVMGFDRNGRKIESLLVLEGLFISYLYSMLLVLDTVVNVTFYKNCVEGLVVFDQETGLRRVRRTRELCTHKNHDSCDGV